MNKYQGIETVILPFAILLFVNWRIGLFVVATTIAAIAAGGGLGLLVGKIFNGTGSLNDILFYSLLPCQVSIIALYWCLFRLRKIDSEEYREENAQFLINLLPAVIAFPVAFTSGLGTGMFFGIALSALWLFNALRSYYKETAQYGFIHLSRWSTVTPDVVGAWILFKKYGKDRSNKFLSAQRGFGLDDGFDVGSANPGVERATALDRILAFWIDFFVAVNLLMVPVVMISKIPEYNQLPFWFYSIVLYNALQIAFSGQTLGGRMVGITVIGKEGLQLGFFRSFIREFLSLFLSIFTLQISMLVLLISKRDQTLHDKICRTYVIRTAHWTPGRKKLVALTSIIILFLDILLLYAVLHK